MQENKDNNGSNIVDASLSSGTAGGALKSDSSVKRIIGTKKSNLTP